jgi:hypothetical protein
MSEQQNQSPIVAELAADSGSTPMYFPVSTLKLVVMSTCTFGIYELYWFYKNWSLIREREKVEMMPFWRACFAHFFCYSLFKKIQGNADSQGLQTSIEPGPLAAGWIVFTFLSKLPDPYWLISFFAVAFLVPVQSAVNQVNAIANPNHDRNRAFSKLNIVGVVIGGLLLALVLAGTFLPDT